MKKSGKNQFCYEKLRSRKKRTYQASFGCSYTEGKSGRLSKFTGSNEVNKKGETSLHLAVKNKDNVTQAFIECLLTEGANVNTRNKWHQTPLHYAAIAESLPKIKTLIKIPGIDVNIRDINGYNALQSLIATTDGNKCSYQSVLLAHFSKLPSLDASDDIGVPEDPNKMVNANLKTCIKILVDAGTDPNNQTVIGNSILHLAARRTDSTALLKYLILNFPDLNMNLVNKRNENFLHQYDYMDSFKNTYEFLEWISELDHSKLRVLLSTRNHLGRTPWTLMIGSALTVEHLRQVISFGVSVEADDNLRNTVLHRACCSDYEGTRYVEVLKYLIEMCGDVNARNIYGQSALSMIYEEEFLDAFLKFNVDFNVKDRWGRIPLIFIMRWRIRPDFLSTIIEKGKVDINTKDVFGSTPLHVAAYQNYEEQVEILLKYGADINALDNLQERPIDTAMRHRSFRCLPLLKSAGTLSIKQVLYGVMTFLYLRNKTFEDILEDIPKSIVSSSVQTAQDIQALFALPRNLNHFMNNLLESYYARNLNYCSEVKDIVSDINTLVGLICKQIGEYDSRFEMSVFPSGSMAEGTKIDRPNEFDFILCLNKLNNITDIVTVGLKEDGFACLQFHENKLAEDYLPFTDMNGYFLPSLFLEYFHNYLQRALNEPHLWEKGNLYFNCENRSGRIAGKPVFTFIVFWLGSVHKQLKIAIDLVPAVYKKGWWPPDTDVDKMFLVDDDIKAAGCLLTLQAKSQESVSHELYIYDCVSKTCNTEENGKESFKNRMMLISAAPAEISLMNSLPKNFRHAYVLAKVLKNICPEIDVETKQYKLDPYNQEYVEPLPTKPSDLISSYMLKNGVFYVLEELKMKKNPVEGLNVSQITVKIYRFLLDFIKTLTFNQYMHMRPFFLSKDINVFRRSKELSFNKRFILQLQREICIKLVLGMLNEQFPKECLATNML